VLRLYDAVDTHIGGKLGNKKPKTSAQGTGRAVLQQIRQAVLNLLRNAREATPSGGAGGVIELSVLAEGMSVVLLVADRGGGIPEGLRERVFDPFFSTKGEGTGLGLATTRRIVEAHGGTLGWSAREGGGTVFRLALPLASADSPRARAHHD
jgi:signal transduction histidine kinase